MMACNGKAFFFFLLVIIVYAGTMLVTLRKQSENLSSIHDVATVLTNSRGGAAQQPLSSRDEMDNCLDIFIPYHISDYEVFILHGGLNSIQQHVKGWRRIFIVSAENTSIAHVISQDGRITWRSEETYSFSPNKQQERLGSWYLQQALKLLAPLEMPEMCKTFLVLDADLHFVRDWSFKATDAKWNYFFPGEFPGGFLKDLAEKSQESTYGITHVNSLNTFGTLCTVHHHMVMQKDVLHELTAHVATLHGKPLLRVLVDAQAKGWWVSEFDIYLAFVIQNFPERVQLAHFPYLHAREKGRCSQRDAQALAIDTDVVLMACHDHYVGHDVCIGSFNNCSSSVAFCGRMSNGNCKAHDYEMVSCGQMPGEKSGEG
jgi:hypothetical protein